MNSRLPIFFAALAFCICPLSRACAQAEKETMAVLNSVNTRLAAGDIKALDDLKPLAMNDAVAGLLVFFKQYFYTYNGTAQQQAIALRAATLATEIPGGDAYFKKLFKKTPEKNSGFLVRQRETAIDCLVAVHNKFAVRVIAECLAEPDLDLKPGAIPVALAKMNLPSAPYSKAALKGTSSPEGIAKWKAWWEANKAQY